MYGSHQGQKGRSMGVDGDYETLRLSDQLYLHIQHAPHFMTSRIDVFIRDRLRPRQNTKLALLSRILERGTRALPSMRAINRFTDDLYGAAFISEIDQFGDIQAIHLGLEVLGSDFLPDPGEDLLSPGLDLLRDVLLHPCRDGDDGFPAATVTREKRALERQIVNLMNDKSAYAQHRCVQEMCRGEAYGLFALGDLRDLDTIDGQDLWRCHRGMLASLPIDIFFSSRQRVAAATVTAFEERFTLPDRDAVPPRRSPIGADRVAADRVAADCVAADRVAADRVTADRVTADRVTADRATTRPAREVTEADDVSQGRLVLGLRTSIDIAQARFAALVVLNHVLGGDGHSRLHRWVREEAGLCYYVGSFLEPLCRLLFIEAGVDNRDFAEARRRIEAAYEGIVQDGLEPEELARAKAHLAQRLLALDDDRESLIRFHLTRRIGETEADRPRLARQIEAVDENAVREAAQTLSLDTVYFLGSGRGVED